MEKAFVVIGVIAVIAFVVGVLKKLSYAVRVEHELRGIGSSPVEIESNIGRSRYVDALVFLRRAGFDPKDAASTLDLYVLKGFAEHSTDPDPQELQLLRVLGVKSR